MHSKMRKKREKEKSDPDSSDQKCNWNLTCIKNLTVKGKCFEISEKLKKVEFRNRFNQIRLWVCCRPRLSKGRPRLAASRGRGPRLAGPASAAPPSEYSLTEPESLIGGKIVVNRKRISLFSVFSDTQLLRRGRRRCSHGGDTSGGGTMMLE